MEHAPLDRACAAVARLDTGLADATTKAQRTALHALILPAARDLQAAAEVLLAAESFGCDTSDDRGAYEGALTAFRAVCTALGVRPASLAREAA